MPAILNLPLSLAFHVASADRLEHLKHGILPEVHVFSSRECHNAEFKNTEKDIEVEPFRAANTIQAPSLCQGFYRFRSLAASIVARQRTEKLTVNCKSDTESGDMATA